MKRLAAVFLSILFASTASAQVISNPSTNARMDGMGVANWQIEDDFNIWINPAQLSNYKNNVYGELGTWASGDSLTTHPFGGVNNDRINPWGGMNVDASYGGWGVYLGRPYSGPLSTLTEATGNAPAANRFDLFYATHGLPLGFYLSYASVSTETKTAGGKATDEGSEINVGAGLLLNNMFDVALNVGLPSSKCQNVADPDGGGLFGGPLTGCPGETVKSDTSTVGNLSLLGRFHMPAGGNSKLLATAQILLGDESVKGEDNTSQTFRLDAAVNSKPNSDTLLVAGAGIVSSASEDKVKATGAKSTEDSLVIPVNVGVEHQTFKAVKTRVGLSKNIYNTSEVKSGGTKVTTVADGNAAVSMGLGWSITDNVMLDAVINQDVLFTGSYMVSGIPETLNSKLSATYRFK